MRRKLFRNVFMLVSLFSFINISFASDIQTQGDASVQNQTSNFVDSLKAVFSKEYWVRVLFAILAILITLVFARIVKDKLFWYLENRLWWDVTWKDEILWVINRTVNVVIIVTGFSITLGVLWLDLTIFIGWVWFGIGFTLRVFLTNFISWVLMVTQWIYHPWDLIKIWWKMWMIKKVYSLFTAIEQFNWVMFFVPNIQFLEDNVENFHTNEKRRLELSLAIDYNVDTVKAKTIIKRVVDSFPNILQAPAPSILIDNLWEWWRSLKLRYRVLSKDDFLSIQSNVVETINLAFKQSGIDIARPRYFVWWEEGMNIQQNTLVEK